MSLGDSATVSGLDSLPAVTRHSAAGRLPGRATVSVVPWGIGPGPGPFKLGRACGRPGTAAQHAPQVGD
jgi:hypothetical protein